MRKIFITLLLLASALWAENVLVSNFCYGIAPGVTPGSLWVLSRGESDNANGYSVIQFGNSGNGLVVAGSSSLILQSGLVAAHDKFYFSPAAEDRRSLVIQSGSLMVGQVYEKDSADEYTSPAGLMRLMDGDDDPYLVEAGGLGKGAMESWKSPLEVSIHAASLGQAGRLWLARGPWGVARTPGNAQSWRDGVAIADTVAALGLNWKQSRWDTIRSPEKLDTVGQLAVLTIAEDSLSGNLWIGSASGLWRGHRDSSALHRIRLGSDDSLRITGLWADAAFQRLVVESSKIVKQKPVSSLWTSWDSGATFAKVAMPYDTLDVSISSVAFLGDTAWLAAQGIENLSHGLIKVRGTEAFQWADSLIDPSREESSRFLWGLEAGVVDRDVTINGVTVFTLGAQKILAVSTDGGGIAVSADQGKTWRQILNQKSVKAGLKEVRMVPSVMRGYGASLVAYRLTKSAKVTIEVFSYDMRKVRTIIRNQSRLADPVRSSNPRDDVWDGRDDVGNPVVTGMYYVRVRDNKGHESWGKVLFLGGAP